MKTEYYDDGLLYEAQQLDAGELEAVAHKIYQVEYPLDIMEMCEDQTQWKYWQKGRYNLHFRHKIRQLRLNTLKRQYEDSNSMHEIHMRYSTGRVLITCHVAFIF